MKHEMSSFFQVKSHLKSLDVIIKAIKWVWSILFTLSWNNPFIKYEGNQIFIRRAIIEVFQWYNEISKMQIFVCLLAQKIGQISTKCLIPKIESFYMKYIDYTSKKFPSPKSTPSKCNCNSHYNCCDNIRGSPFNSDKLLFYSLMLKMNNH